jgi:uncharacterized membrane protein
MKRSQLTVALSLLAVFCSGAVVGAFGHRLYAVRSVAADLRTPPRPSPEDWRKQYVQELTTRLKLEQPQVAQLNTILDNTRDRFRLMKEKSKPEADQIRQDQRNSVRSMLNALQQSEYDRILQERDDKRRAARKP